MIRFLVLLLLLTPLVQCVGTREPVPLGADAPRLATQADLAVMDRDALRKELAATRLREGQLVDLIKQRDDEALQFKLYLGAGALIAAGILLIALGLWTTRSILLQIGAGAFGLAACCLTLAWLVPYALWIGLGVVILAAAGAVLMLVNRERTLRQVTAAVDQAKADVPAFADHYKGIFRENVDGFADRILNSVRKGRTE